jgi:general secretion pathway protein K
MNGLYRQRGAAIIVALFVTSLVVIASVAMITRLRIDLRNTELLTNAIQGRFYAEGSIAWAMEQLNTNWSKKKPNQLVDATPIRSPVNKVNNATISSTIYDPQGRFNINNLSDSKLTDSFSTLITIVDPNIEMDTAHMITLAIIDWISATVKNNDLDSYYLKLNPAYRAPHRPMVSISELRLVKGITPKLYAALAPYVIALPETTKININSASAPVLMCLSNTLTRSSANAIIAKRQQTPFATTQQFLALDILKNNPIPEDRITTISNYFLVKTSVKVDQQDILLYTLLQRIEKNSKPYEVMLWQSKGTL